MTSNTSRRTKRCRQSSRRATTRRETQVLQHISHHRGVGATSDTGIAPTSHRLPRIAYEDFRSILDRRLANIKGGISDEDIRKIAYEWNDEQEMGNFDEQIVQLEADRLAKRYEKSHGPAIGHMPENKEDGRWRFMCCQVNGMATQSARERKVREMSCLARKYDVNGIVVIVVDRYTYHSISVQYCTDTYAYQHTRRSTDKIAHNI